ncbi:MAG: hypothetical protein J7K40_13785 [candidate division Zixibacteria bacterium]|nr:hypothetical protein [candidate division Zixibacteria bacterium]
MDDNRREIAIFADKKGNRTLVRYVHGGCDDTCPTVQAMLKNPDDVPTIEECYKKDSELLSEIKAVLKEEITDKDMKKTIEKLRSIVADPKTMDIKEEEQVKEEENEKEVIENDNKSF